MSLSRTASSSRPRPAGPRGATVLLSGGARLPLTTVPAHCIERNDELAHASHEANLSWLASQTLGKSLDGRISSRCDHGRHVEGIAYQGSSGLDSFAADLAPRTAIERSDTNQCRDLPPGQDPSSGSRAIRVVARTGPTPGTVRR